MTQSEKTQAYVAVKGFDYPPSVRVEPGQDCTGLPATLVPGLLAKGAIRKKTKKDGG